MAEKSPKSIRIVIDIPNTSVSSLKVLCDLMGETQSAMVTMAVDAFVEKHQDTIDKFLDLRNELKK